MGEAIACPAPPLLTPLLLMAWYIFYYLSSSSLQYNNNLKFKIITKSKKDLVVVSCVLLFLGTIHLRRRQISTNFWPLPPYRRQFFNTICRQVWPIFDPYPPKTCRRPKWMVPYLTLNKDCYTSLHSRYSSNEVD